MKNKKKLDYDGTEYYIFEKIEKEDLSWFPIQRALSLSNTNQEEENDVKEVFEEKIQSVEKKILETIELTSAQGNKTLASPTKSKLKARRNQRKAYVNN